MRTHRVRVSSLPAWLPWQRLLGPGPWRASASPGDEWLSAEAELSRDEAADLAARLRAIGIGGRALLVDIDPPLPRSAVRKGRLEEARRMREGSAGFTRPGARLDAEARYSLTPEPLALELGRRAAGAHVVDAGCGAGGNAIGFARTGCSVTAIELDRARLDMARWNARLYGVEDRIQFLAGDARELVPTLAGDLLFVDPPWGGRYDKRCVSLPELPLLEILLAQRARFARLWAKVPPAFDVATVPGARPHAFFGAGAGDAQRVKFLLLEIDRPA